MKSIIDFIPIENIFGCYWTHDGYFADLGWNPHEQLKTKPKRVSLIKKLKQQKGYEVILNGIQDLEIPSIIVENFFKTCDWCNRILEDGEEDICLQCLFKTCASCGKVYKSISKNSKTCSSECSQILNTERGRWMILERDDFTCVYCGQSAPDNHALLHVDHIIPVASGGRSIAANLITSCTSCNSEKSKRRMSDRNEVQIAQIARQRNKKRNIENRRLMRLRQSDIV